MAIFSVYIYTNHVNNKWIQTIEICEGELDYTCIVDHEDENVVTSKIVGEFKALYPRLSYLNQKVIAASTFGRQQFMMKDREICNIAVQQDVSNDQFENHISCCNKIDTSGAVTRQNAKNNGIPNYDMKHHFKQFGAEKSVMDFFTENKCSDCRASYNEILEEDQHIVIPQCGHPICCKCCDETLRIKPNCPLGREDMDIWKKGEFVVMKFDTNLQLLPQERRIYY